MNANVVPLHPDKQTRPAPASAVAEAALTYLDRCALAENTRRAYHRQIAAYVAWLEQHHQDHLDAFDDIVGAEAAVTAWRRHLLKQGHSPATVNQALAALGLLYEHGAGLRISIKRARIPRPGEPEALTPREQGRLERAADRRGPRDAALIALLLYTGARAAEATRLQVEDLAITARTGTCRLLGKGDQVRTVPIPAAARERLTTWLHHRGAEPGPLWTGQRGALTTSGVTQAVLSTGEDAGLTGLRPHRLRHTYATRLRHGGADPAQIQALLGHSSSDTTARYFRAGKAETVAVVEHAFQP